MNTYDRGSSLFWFFYSMFIFIESLHLGIGKLHNPGAGFMAFLSSGLLGILSLALFLQSISKREEPRGKPIFAGTFWKRGLMVLIALMIYSWFLPLAGYLISTFILMSFLFWIVEQQKAWQVLILSFLTTILTYYVFSKWLNCQFPVGLFRL